MEYNPLFDKLWGADGINPFGHPDKLEQYMNDNDLEIEVCEFIKGDIKTVVICKFNSKGYIVSHTAHSEDISQSMAYMTNLKDELLTAIQEQRFEDAVVIQKKINDLRTVLEKSKPTF